MRNPRRERRTRRRIDLAAEFAAPLGKPRVSAEWLAAHDEVADLFDGPHGRPAAPLHVERSDPAPSPEPKSPEGR
jgi:hypothetical protein